MDTPILDFVNNYASADFSRLHMPGHKGNKYIGFENLDITEIRDADELYCCDGIIRQSEKNATFLFGTDNTFYSTEGSSHCIRTMIFLIRQFSGKRNPLILAARNAHKAFLYACALSDVDVEWAYPDQAGENSIATCQISSDTIAAMLLEMKNERRLPDAVYITSPDYLGQCADIQAISEVCHSFGCLLAVDNAHGAYLHFLNRTHPMDLGADICCDSAHKTLPVITGGAYLHVSKKIADTQNIKAALELTGTTSPSYLIMASLDNCNRYLADNGCDKYRQASYLTSQFKKKVSQLGITIIKSEELKIVINAAQMGFTGSALGEILRKHMCEPEFCDKDFLVCMTSPDTGKSDLDRLYNALKEAVEYKRPPLDTPNVKAVRCIRSLGIRDAVFSQHKTVRVEEAEGLVCGSPCVSCPPAIPVVISGEIISHEAIEIMKQYDIEFVSVVV